MKRKHHYGDQHGPICGANQLAAAFAGPRALREVRKENLETITCLRCVKKLREWGFAIQSFSDAVKEAIKV